MANEIYANGMEVACKAGAGKTICAMPDVCFTPPESPPPGAPVPYPNTGFASDTTEGSKTVKISGEEIMLKNKSYFKKSTGDEAGCAAKKGMLSSTNTGKVYFIKWSMDVKFEGENVDRHLDMTTDNHNSPNANEAIPWAFVDAMSVSKIEGEECKKQANDFNTACGDAIKKNKRPVGSPLGEFNNEGLARDMCDGGSCQEARKCILMAYKIPCCEVDDEQGGKKKQTPHHIVPKSQFKMPGAGDALDLIDPEAEYEARGAPCICAQGRSHSTGKHGEIHATTNIKTRDAVGVGRGTQIPDTKRWSVSEAEKVGAEAVEEETGCLKECVEQQLRKGHQAMGIKGEDRIRPTTAGGEPKPENDIDM